MGEPAYYFLNGTEIPGGDRSLCTFEICPSEYAQFHYEPKIPGNAALAGIFGICLAVQLFLGIKHKTWGFMAAMCAGLLLEIIGYVGRIMLHDNPFSFDNFLLYLIPLTIGPAFLSAATYLCLGRIIVIYNPSISRLQPRTYTILFVSCDLLSLILQAAGGALASVADTPEDSDIGINIMIAGLVSQVASLSLFMLLCGDFAWSAKKRYGERDPAYTSLRASPLWKAFLWALAGATVLIFVRSCFRVAELFEGFDSELAADETLFMVLEGAMVGLASILLTALHPGVAFKGNFNKAVFHLRGKKQEQKYDDLEMASEERLTTHQVV